MIFQKYMISLSALLSLYVCSGFETFTINDNNTHNAINTASMRKQCEDLHDLEDKMFATCLRNSQLRHQFKLLGKLTGLRINYFRIIFILWININFHHSLTVFSKRQFGR